MPRHAWSRISAAWAVELTMSVNITVNNWRGRGKELDSDDYFDSRCQKPARPSVRPARASRGRGRRLLGDDDGERGRASHVGSGSWCLADDCPGGLRRDLLLDDEFPAVLVGNGLRVPLLLARQIWHLGRQWLRH